MKEFLDRANNFIKLEEAVRQAQTRGVWSSINVPKHRFILWQVVNDQLLTRNKMLQFRVLLDNVECPVCAEVAESIQHLFFECNLSYKVADQVQNWLGVGGWPKEFQAWKNRLVISNKNKNSRICTAVMAAMVYRLWLNRNNCVFNGFSSTITSILVLLPSAEFCL
ncbi:uncharacterized protein LOC133034534 [Cannabis sativa]|uniref:uncharacterized protein LOC133034534 n=1 Tax=Cannabis sativa TaxID=3483 RepID=UPI0029C9E7FE|nr:uncharacterized protein LOC133034534 [Cannabis sativa]